MFEDFLISQHICDRYRERVDGSVKNIKRKINQELHFSKVKQIINNGNVRHIFTLHSKEFIFVRKGRRWILKTIIKRSRLNNDHWIEKRKRESKQLISA